MKNKPLDRGSRGSGMFTSSTHSFDDLCGGELLCAVWWRFEQAKDGRGRKQKSEEAAVWQWASFFLFLFFFLRSFCFVLIRGLSDKYQRVMWQDSIGWHKTLVLRHNLTQCFLS